MDARLINFDQILGQDSAIAAIRRACSTNRLPHGLIFAGPAGVGKETTARALAALFLCEQPRELACCGACSSCRLMAAETHPDYHLIDRLLIRTIKDDSKAKELVIDVIRDFLLDKAANTSVMGAGKVFVVREAELMNAAAQNCLLKVLEEPPGRTLIILLTDQPDALLTTVRSRCQLIRFGRLDATVVARVLARQAVSAEQAQEAAQFTEGSVGLALRWLQDGVIERARQLTGMLQELQAGRSAEGLRQWLMAAAEEYTKNQLARDELASKDQVMREAVVVYLKLCGQYFDRRLSQLHGRADALERCCAAIDAVLAAERLVEANVNLPLCVQQFVGALEEAFGVDESSVPAGR